MATRVLSTTDSTVVLGTDISGQQTVDLAIDQRVFRSLADVNAQAIAGAGTTVKGIWIGGRAAFGDLGAPILATYSASPITTHDGYITSNSGAVYWVIAPGQGITSKFFGAAWDGSTDDYIANNKWAKFLRVTQDWGRMPNATSYNSRTLYFGCVRFRGAGSAANSLWRGAKSIILTDGQPGISAASSSTLAVEFGHEHWEGFCVKGAGGALTNDDGSVDGTIDLWDYLAYPYQVLLWFGRSHMFMQATTDVSPEGPSTSIGDGTFTLRDFLVEDAPGWGMVGYKQYGRSVIEEGFGRRCGGRAASVLGDDTLGGTILLASGCVDISITDVHSINSAYSGGGYSGPDYGGADYSDTATGIRVGAAKTATDALDRYAEATNNIIISRFHTEAVAIAEDWRWCKYGEANSTNSNGGEIRMGWGSNPSTDCRVTRTSTRIAGADLLAGQSPFLALGEIINPTPGTTIYIKYWNGVSVELVGAGHATEGTYTGAVALDPQPDITTQPGGASLTDDYNRLPHVITKSAPISLLSNSLPAFSASGTPTTLANWTADAGAGTITVVNQATLRLSGGASVYYDVTGLTAGQVFTFELFCAGIGSIGLGSTAFAVRTTTGTAILTRTLGTGTETDGSYHKLFNATVPTGETAIRLRLFGGSANPIEWKAPSAFKGAAPSVGSAPPMVWPARGELIATV